MVIYGVAKCITSKQHLASRTEDMTNNLRENDETVGPSQKHSSDSIQGTDCIANVCIILFLEAKGFF